VKFVVVGGDAAGMTAAAQARRRRSESELEIVAFERGAYTSYSACGLPYLVGGDVDDIDQLIARTPEDHRENGIDIRMRHEVVSIDLDARTVTARDLENDRDVTEPFDELMIATGSTPVRPDLPGVDAPGVYGIQTLTDGIALRDQVVEGDAKRAVIVGGGYVGLEMAEALHQRGLDVTMIESAEQPMSTLDPDMGALVADAIRKIGIELRTETKATAFDVDDNGQVRAVVTDDGSLPADIVVLGIGVRPNTQLARDAGIVVGEFGGITTNTRLATSAEGVWAAGDCIESHHRVSRRPVFVALGTHANKQGRIVGINATGGDEHFLGIVGTAVVKVCAYEIGRTGLTEREATDAGIEYVTATIEASTHATYLPDALPITVKVLAERGSAVLLGAQIIGREGAGKRVDVFATAIWSGMSVDEFQQLDLGYAPPLSPVWDPVLVAARKITSLV
jgi:NADPH-dependent 2,4-dienoyl-CoA reductase/sulfur reductase-like enzyme